MIKVLNVGSLYSSLYATVEFLKLHKDEEIEIVVPDKLSLFMERFLFEKMNMSASFNLQVSTMNRFAKKSCKVDKSKQISKIGSILLIHRILNENLNNLEILKNKAYSFNYAEDVFKTITQLKASRISFEEMKGFSSNDERLKGKIHDLALVYEEYEKGKAGLLDTSDWFLMSSFDVSKGREGKKILFVGFDDFTAIQYSIIERLAIDCEVFVMNYFSKSQNKHIFNSEVFSQLKNISYINQLSFNVEEIVVSKSNLKKFLEENLFGLKPLNFTLDKEIVKIYSGSNFTDEIEFVARDIKRKILSNARFDDFGVAVYNLETKLSKIKEVFEKYEINYYLDNEISLQNSVIYKFFASVLKYNMEGYGLSHLVDIINSPFIDLSIGEKREVVQALIKVKFRGKINEKTNLEVEDVLKTKLVENFRLLIFEKTISVKELVERLKNLFEELKIQEVITALAKDDLQNATMMNKSKDTIFTLFDEILTFNSNADAEMFFDIFTHVVGVIKISNLPLSLDAVKLVDANNSMEIFKEFYLVGASHDNAPSLKFDCGIILDTEIEKLNFKNKLSPTISHINKLMKLRLFNTIGMFENELTITYSSSQSEVVRELLERIMVNSERGEINILPISKFEFPKQIALSKWDLIEKQCGNDFEKINKNHEKIVKNKDFSIISQNNLKIYDNFNEISATNLENYCKCPFYAFLNNILKIQPRLESDILSLDIGNILHEILFEYYQKKKQVGDIFTFCQNKVMEMVEQNDRLKLNENSPILINLIDEAVRVLNAVDYIDKNSNFVPTHFEFPFSDKTALKLRNISLKGKVDRVDVCGDMFRVVDYKSGSADANLKELYYGNKLQLFLYSCAMENALNLKTVGNFYLPLHNAYTKDEKNTYAMKGFYLAEDFVVKAFDNRLIAGGKSDIVNVKLNKDGSITKNKGNKELQSKDLLALKEYSKKVSEQAVDEIKSGFVQPTPSDVKKPCEYCPYVHVCMKESNGIEFRQSKKVDLNSFAEVEDEGV